MTTLPAWLSVPLLLLAGITCLWVAQRTRHTGELPAGSNGLRAFRPRRDESPAAFYFFLTLYLASGVALVAYGLAMALGRVAPLRLF
jgi:hypothetical protein